MAEQQGKALGAVEDLVDAEGETGTLAVLARAEINQQIATAKAYPRSITEFMREAEQLATLNPEMARACVYALPRGGKVIEGPSARFAEIIAYSFRNMRFGARPLMEEDEYITSQGVTYDLERNNGTTIEVRRRITNSGGDRFNADMISVTANAANSIALRNAVLKIIPKAIWNPIYQKARHVIMGDHETFNNRLGKLFEEFVRYGVTKEMICAKLAKKGVADIKIDDMVVLAGMLTSLQEGDASAETMFDQMGDSVRQPSERKEEAKEAPKQPSSRTKVDEDAERIRQGQAGKGSARKGKVKETGESTPKDAPVDPGARQQAPQQPESASVEQKATPNMVKQIKLRIESYGVDEQKLRAKFGVGEIADLPAARVNDVLQWIEENGSDA